MHGVGVEKVCQLQTPREGGKGKSLARESREEGEADLEGLEEEEYVAPEP